MIPREGPPPQPVPPGLSPRTTLLSLVVAVVVVVVAVMGISRVAQRRWGPYVGEC